MTQEIVYICYSRDENELEFFKWDTFFCYQSEGMNKLFN